MSFENAKYDERTTTDKDFTFYREVMVNTAGPAATWIAARDIPNLIGACVQKRC